MSEVRKFDNTPEVPSGQGANVDNIITNPHNYLSMMQHGVVYDVELPASSPTLARVVLGPIDSQGKITLHLVNALGSAEGPAQSIESEDLVTHLEAVRNMAQKGQEIYANSTSPQASLGAIRDTLHRITQYFADQGLNNHSHDQYFEHPDSNIDA